MTNTGDEGTASANRAFVKYFVPEGQTEATFPDVSLFDSSVASLWKGASKTTVDGVRVAWDDQHVSRVVDVFDRVLSRRGGKVAIQKHVPNQATPDFLAAFVRSARSI
jgi:hypothetical protein